jgi:hypothetical protein
MNNLASFLTSTLHSFAIVSVIAYFGTALLHFK